MATSLLGGGGPRQRSTPRPTAPPVRRGRGGSLLGGTPSRVVQAAEAAQAPPENSHGLLGGLLHEAGGILKGAVPGAIHLASDLGKETYNFAKDAPHDIAHGFAHPFSNPHADKTPEQRAAERPFSTGFVESGKRTAGRISHPGRYVEAAHQGHLLGAVIEDASNIALVGAVSSKVLGRAGAGALAEGEAARATAEQITERTLPKLRAEYAKQAERVAADEALAVGEAGQTGQFGKLYTQTNDARDALALKKSTIDSFEAQAAEKHALADASLASVHPGLLRAYRLSNAVETLGAKAGSAPFAPFGLTAKVAGKAVSALLGLNPALKERLGEYATRVSVRGATALGLAERDTVLHGYKTAIDRMAKRLGSDDLFHAAMLDLTGAGPLLSEAHDHFAIQVGEAQAAEALRRLAESPELQATPEALQMAFDLHNHRLDPELEAKIRQAQEIYRAEIATPQQDRYKAGAGTSEQLTPEGLAQRQWNAEGTTPNPQGEAALRAEQAARQAAQEATVADAKTRADEAYQRIALPEEARADIAGTIRQNQATALEVAQGLVDNALNDPAALGELRRMTRSSENISTDELAVRLAHLVERAAKDGPIARRFPELAAAARGQGIIPIARGPQGALNRVEKLARTEGAARATMTHAARVSRYAERLRGTPAAVERVVGAVESLLKARSRADRLAGRAAKAREEIAARYNMPSPDELPDHMVDSAEYARRGGDRAEHATVVAEAVGRAEPVPPWVLDEYRTRAREDRAAGRAVDPDVATIIRGQRNSAAAWNRSPAGKLYTQIRNETRDLRTQVHEAAQEYLDATAHSAMPDKLPFAPGGTVEHLDSALHRLGGPEWSIADDMRRMREGLSSATALRTRDETLFVRAYKARWNRLAPEVKVNFERLSDRELSLAYQKWQRGELDVASFGIDEHMQEWGGAGFDRATTPGEWLDAWERRARVRPAAAHGAAGGFTPAMLDGLRQSIEDPAMREALSNEQTRTMLTSGTIEWGARQMFDPRLAAAADRTIPIPDAAAMSQALDALPLSHLTESEMEGAVSAAFGGDSVKTEDFLSAWVRAGEPDLEAALVDLAAGNPPVWAQPGPTQEGLAAVARASRRAGAANRLDQAVEAHRYPEPLLRADAPGRSKLTPEERAIADAENAQRQARNPEPRLRQAIDQAGGATAASRLSEQVQTTAEAAQARADAAAAVAPDARAQATAKIAEAGYREGVLTGRQLEQYRRAVRDLRVSERRLARMPDRFAIELDRYAADLKNAPAAYRQGLYVARGASKVFEDWSQELLDHEHVDPSLVMALDQMQVELVKTLADITNPGWISNADGTLTQRPPLYEPTFVPGGRAREGRGPALGPAPSVPNARKAAGQRYKKSAVMPRTPQELQDVLTQRVHREILNQTSRQMESLFGVRPSQVIAPEDLQALTEHYGENTKGLSEDIIRQMREHGFHPWDPRKLYPGEQNPHGLGTVRLAGEGDLPSVDTTTVFLPSGVIKEFEGYFKGPGSAERWFRRWYDRPTNVWKAGVLALSPRWHVNNIVGNFIMATVGGGITPAAWAHQMRNAYAVMKADDLRFASEHPDLQPTGVAGAVNRALGGTEKRLGRAERRLADVPADMQTVDPRIIQRGAGARGLDPYADTQLTTPGNRVTAGVRKTVQGSYHFNGFADDLNRVALWLEKSKSMSDLDVAKFAEKNPLLSSLKGDVRAVRQEAAVRMSLDALGNFVQMKPWERQIARRVIPFYAWLRHITKLALHLPVTAPTRVVWMLHLAEMYGDPPEFDFLSGTLPTGGDSFLRLPRGNPFEDASVSPTKLLSSIGPVPRLAGAAALGIDVGKPSLLTRPPGTGNVDDLQNPLPTPLASRPTELLSFASQLLPQGRILRTAADEATYGHPVQHYQTGEPIFGANHQPVPGGTPAKEQLKGLVGLPYTIHVNTAGVRRTVAARKRSAAKLRQRSTGGTAPTLTRRRSGSLLGG